MVIMNDVKINNIPDSVLQLRLELNLRILQTVPCLYDLLTAEIAPIRHVLPLKSHIHH